MSNWSPQQVRLVNGLLLAGIMVLALVMASLPRWEEPYPIHSDEWTHLAAAQSLLDTGETPYPDPTEAGAVFDPDIAIGFHILMGEIKAMTGMAWFDIFRFVPGIILMMLAWLTYVLVGRHWKGLVTAFLVILIPTTVRFLGPAFLVPVALGLTFIPLVLLIIWRYLHTWRGPALLFVTLLSLLFIHPPTFGVLSIIAAFYAVYHIWRNKGAPRWTGMMSLGGIIAAYVIMYFWAPSFLNFIVAEGSDPARHLPLPPIGDIVSIIGYLPAALFVIGIGVVTYRGKMTSRILVIGTIGFLAFLFVYPRVYIGPDIVYERGWLYIFFLMGVFGAETVMGIWRGLAFVFRRNQGATRVTGLAVICILLAAALIMSFKGHLTQPYYRLVDDAARSEMYWIGKYVPEKYRYALTEIGPGAPLAAISGKHVYIGEVTPARFTKFPLVAEFFAGSAGDTEWLVEEGLSIVYTGSPVENEDLIKVNRNSYILLEK